MSLKSILWELNRQMDRQTDRWTDRQTDRQTDMLKLIVLSATICKCTYKPLDLNVVSIHNSE
jgi:hypothetical protein